MKKISVLLLSFLLLASLILGVSALESVKNGPQADGFFYLNDVKQLAYQLVEFDGDWYFINDSHKIAKSTRLYLSQKFVDGTPFNVGFFDFDEDGRMIVKNGPQADGYFYQNGSRLNAYQLAEYNGNWYFINDGHKYAKSIRLYLGQQFVDGTPFNVGFFDFDEDGRMIVKNGPQADGYLYLNNVKQLAYQLVEFDGDWYFINDGHKYAKNIRLYLGQQFVDGTPFNVGFFDFDEDGRMIVKNGPQADGYLYLNNVKQLAYQLVEFDDDWYFINDGHKYAKSIRLYLGQQFVDGTPFNVGFFNFDEDGRMIVKNGPQADGFFYLNNVKQLAYQLIKYHGDYYFINDCHKYARNTFIYLSAKFIGDEPLAVGYYYFGDDGAIQATPYCNGTGSHEYDAVETPPTCDERGYTTHTCARCGESYVDSYINAFGHDCSEPAYVWSFANGVSCTATATCSTCGKAVEETVTAALESQTDATCGEPGLSVYLADFDNALFEDQHYEIETYVDHTLSYSFASEWELELRCTVCGEVVETTTYPEYAGMTYKSFTKLSNLQKINIENNLGEDVYNRWVLYLKDQQEAIEFGGEV